MPHTEPARLPEATEPPAGGSLTWRACRNPRCCEEIGYRRLHIGSPRPYLPQPACHREPLSIDPDTDRGRHIAHHPRWRLPVCPTSVGALACHSEDAILTSPRII